MSQTRNIRHGKKNQFWFILSFMLMILFSFQTKESNALSLLFSSPQRRQHQLRLNTNIYTSNNNNNNNNKKINLFLQQFKVNQLSGQPRLCIVIQGIIGICIRILLGIRQSKELSISITAKTNRKVVEGQLQEFSVLVRNSQGPYLYVDELVVKGTNLDFGYWPLFYTIGIPFLLIQLRPIQILFLLTGMSWYYTTKKKKRHDEGSISSSSQQQKQPLSIIISWCKKQLDGTKPCTLNYNLILSEKNVAQSRLLQMGLRSVLRSLMIHSVLGVAASTLDTMTQQLRIANNKASSSSSSSSFSGQQQQQSPRRLGPASSIVPGSSSSSSSFQDNSWSSSTSKMEDDDSTTSNENKNKFQQQQPILTKLLEATSFELINTSFVNGHVISDADAVLPNKGDDNDNNLGVTSSSSSRRRRLSYTLRTTPQVIITSSPTPSSSLGLIHPECRVSVEGVAKNLLGTNGGSIVERFLPDAVWFPVGPGVALPIGRRHHIQQWKTTEGLCHLIGEYRINHEQELKKDDDDGWMERIQKAFPFSDLDS